MKASRHAAHEALSTGSGAQQAPKHTSTSAVLSFQLRSRGIHTESSEGLFSEDQNACAGRKRGLRGDRVTRTGWSLWLSQSERAGSKGVWGSEKTNSSHSPCETCVGTTGVEAHSLPSALELWLPLHTTSQGHCQDYIQRRVLRQGRRARSRLLAE